MPYELAAHLRSVEYWHLQFVSAVQVGTVRSSYLDSADVVPDDVHAVAGVHVLHSEPIAISQFFKMSGLMVGPLPPPPTVPQLATRVTLLHMLDTDVFESQLPQSLYVSMGCIYVVPLEV